MNTSVISDNKSFWKTVKPLFSNKSLNTNRIILNEDNKLIKDDEQIAITMNEHFTNITKKLNLKPDQNFETPEDDDINRIIKKYQNHLSIKKINQQNFDSIFKFSEVSENEILKELTNLSTKKSTISNDIPANILKESRNTLAVKLTSLFNECIRNNNFPDSLKKAEITPIYKKGDSSKKENYRPISNLSNISKIFERILHNQISNYMESKFSKHLCGFRKNNNTQNSLLRMIEYWKKNLDKRYKVGALIMDLSKAFDTLNHDLILAKLHAYGFDKNSLKFLKSYLSSRIQRTKVNNSFSNWLNIICGVPQGSILGPLLFNIFINDIFQFVNKESELCNYADDNTLYVCNKDINFILAQLKKGFYILNEWFYENFMILNPEKCSFFCLGLKKKKRYLSIFKKELH